MKAQSHSKNTTSIIWPLDPYQKQTKLWNKSLSTVKTFSKALKQNVSPLYVLDLKAESLSNERAEEKYKSLEQKTSEFMSRRLKKIKGLKTKPPLVLLNFDSSVRGEAESVTAFSKAHKTDLIIAPTQSRTSLSRFFKESFVEELVAQKGIPVLSINPNTKPCDKIKKIVFASDFSSESFKAFQKLCPLAKTLGAKIILYSVVPTIAYLGEESQFAALTMAQRVSEKGWEDFQVEELKKMAIRFEKVAAKFKIPIESVIDEDALSVTKAVLKFSKQSKADLVALAAISNPASLNIFGNLTRYLIRNSSVPVWTYRVSKK